MQREVGPKACVVRAAALLALAALTGGVQAQVCDGQFQTGIGVPGISGNGSGYLTSWDPDGAGPQGELLIVGGNYKLANTTQVTSLATWEPTFNVNSPFGIWRDLAGGVKTAAGARATVRFMQPVGTDLIVAGSFARCGPANIAASNIAKLDGLTNTWIPYGPGLNGPVYNTLIWNGILYASGNFFVGAGNTRGDSIARWNGSTWVRVGAGFQNPDPMNPLPATVPANVYAIGVLNNELYAAGDFVFSGRDMTGNPIPCFQWAKWLPQFGVWSSILSGSLAAPFPYTPAVYTMKTYGNRLYAGGVWDNLGFSLASTAGGAPAPTNGGVFKVFGVSQVFNIGQVATEMIVAGDFEFAGAAQTALCRNVVRWDGLRFYGVADGGTLGPVNAVTQHRGQLAFMGPIERTMGGLRLKNIGWYDGSAGFYRRLGTGFDHQILAMTTYNNQLVVAGEFGRTQQEFQTPTISSFNGTTWFPIGEGLATGNGVLAEPTSVYGLTTYQNKLIAVGSIPMALPGTSMGNIAAWDGTRWSPVGQVDGPVYSAKEYRGELFITGDITNYGNICQYDGFGYNAIGFGMDAAGLSLDVHADRLIVGGLQTGAGGVATGPISRYNYDTETWSALSPTQTTWVSPDPANIPVYVSAVANIDGTLYAGGNFVSINGNAALKNIVRFNNATSRWEAMGTGPGFEVWVIKQIGGRLFVGGTGGTNIAFWTGTAWQTPDGGTDGPVWALAEYQNKLWAGGNFLTASNEASSYLTSYTLDTPVNITQTPVGGLICPSGQIVLTVQSSGTQPLTYQWFRNDVAIPNSNSSTFTVTAANAGRFKVRVSNICSNFTTANVTVEVCPADYNCDGFADAFDYDDYVSAFEIGGINADFNNDGFVDIFDYDDFVGAFEGGCGAG